MNDFEKDYVKKVEETVNKHSNAVEAIDELAKIKKPNTDGLSLNTLIIIESINNLNWEREDGELDVYTGDWDAAELRIAKELLDNIKDILEDIEKGNWYRRAVFTIVLAYSKLQGEDYQYKLIKKRIEPSTLDEAEKLAAEIKASTPKAHPDDPSFTLEDIRVRDCIVDSNNRVLGLRVQNPILTD